MKGVISSNMQTKLEERNISYEILVDCFKSKGAEEVVRLLQGENNSIIKSKKIILNILQYLKTKA